MQVFAHQVTFAQNYNQFNSVSTSIPYSMCMPVPTHVCVFCVCVRVRACVCVWARERRFRALQLIQSWSLDITSFNSQLLQTYCIIIYTDVPNKFCSISLANWSKSRLGLLSASISWFQDAFVSVSNHLANISLQHSSTLFGWFACIVFNWIPRSLHLGATVGTTWLCRSLRVGQPFPAKNNEMMNQHDI